MKTGTLILLGLTLSLIGILVIANNIENGDINAISMYFVVYIIPAIGLSFINGFLLNIFQKRFKKLIQLIILGLIPIGLLIISLFLGNLRMSFVAEFGLIGIGTTNLIWIIRLLIIKEKARKPNNVYNP
jgi:hypothetical protein